jgi:hypothetical protein
VAQDFKAFGAAEIDFHIEIARFLDARHVSACRKETNALA